MRHRTASRCGPFELEVQLARGDQCRVWRACRLDGQSPRQVAIKLWDSCGDASVVTSMQHAGCLHEQQLLAGLAHPQIPALLDSGVDAAQQPWLALELVEGQPLTLHANAHSLRLDERITLFLRALEVVDHVHQLGILHADLKPQHLLVDAQAQVNLLDFGAARRLEESPLQLHRPTGPSACTPNYAAPEQIAGGMLGQSTDVYALGVILFEMLTGRRPCIHRGGDLQLAQSTAQWQVQPPSVVALQQGHIAPQVQALRGELDALLLRCLQRDPQCRYPTVRALGADLQRYLAGRAIQSPITPHATRAPPPPNGAG